MNIRSAITFVGVFALSACTKHVEITAIDTAFQAQPSITMAFDSGSATLMLMVARKSSGLTPGRVETRFPIGPMLKNRLHQYVDRVFRLPSADDMRVSVAITDWHVNYVPRHGLFGKESLDSLMMKAVLTVTYKRAARASSTRTYTYQAVAQADRGQKGRRNDAAVAGAMNDIVRQLMHDIVDRTTALRRRSG